MYISLEVVTVWHHVILCACLRCVWITVQADTVYGSQCRQVLCMDHSAGRYCVWITVQAGTQCYSFLIILQLRFYIIKCNRWNNIRIFIVYFLLKHKHFSLITSSGRKHILQTMQDKVALLRVLERMVYWWCGMYNLLLRNNAKQCFNLLFLQFR
jgi:hypothetical protein